MQSHSWVGSCLDSKLWSQGWNLQSGIYSLASEVGVLGALENSVHFLPRAALTEPVLGSSQEFPCVSASLSITDCGWGLCWGAEASVLSFIIVAVLVSFSFLWQNTRKHYLKRRGLLWLRASEVFVCGCFGPMVCWPSESMSPRVWLSPTPAPRSHLLKAPLPPINSP